MKTIKGDLLEGDWDYACHVCNLYKTMGAGVAYFLRKKWPEVYDADCVDDRLEYDKIGEFSKAKIINDGRFVYNLYAMFGIGSKNSRIDSRQLSYDYLLDSLLKMKKDIRIYNRDEVVIGIPCLMGCGLAGGDWATVEKIIEQVEDPSYKFVAYMI